VTTATKLPAQYLDCFTEFERRAAGGELPWLRQLRREAFARFCEVGFPTTHDEDWRFTNVAPIATTAFQLPRGVPTFAEERQIWATCRSESESLVPQLDTLCADGAACRLVFINGLFAQQLSECPGLASGVKVSSLARELATETPERALLERHLGHYADTRRDSFLALNTAFAEDGAYVHVARGAVVEGPIYLLFLSTLESTPIMSHPRNLILADDNSQLTVAEDYVWLGSGSGLCNALTELVAGDGAIVAHYRIERDSAGASVSANRSTASGYNISTLRVEQGRSSNVTSHSVLLGGALVRNNVHPVLNGEGGECLINGLFVGAGREHLDNYMLVEHAKPHCGSRQFYNGILDGRAHGVFHGRIIVHKDAQKTDAKQTNRNLLLSDEAQIDSKPQLEIYADDVKCTHGATIGQMDEEALFYLRSRGIDEAAARKHLLLAFAEECIERMQAGPARSHVERLVRQSLQQDVRA
jgi:Fe-S cluster assembly protein SufD